jgi:adenine-specific DNA-methyltransferase
MGKLFWEGKAESIEKLINQNRKPFTVIERFESPINASLVEFDKHFRDNQEKSDIREVLWKNHLFLGDNILVMGSLLKDFKEKITLIYFDPPFHTGGEFNYKIQIGEGINSKKSSKWVRKKAYDDSWKDGIDSYLNFMHERLLLMKELLANNGCIYVHLDWHVGHYVKIMMDEIFGLNNFRNEIIWAYPAASAQTKRFYVRSFDIILFYSKSDDYIFNDDPNIYMEYSDRVKNALVQDEKGTFYYRGGSHDGKKLSQKVYTAKEGVFPRDVWTDIPYIRANTKEYQGFSTQKPERLLKRIILASSNEEDLVADFFCGSGTTLAVAEKLKRRWIGCDRARHSIQIVKKRMLDIHNSNNLYEWKESYNKNVKPFKLLASGPYNPTLTIPSEFLSIKVKSKEDKEITETSVAKLDINRQNNEVIVRLTNFVVNSIDFISNDVKDSITSFSDWVDYWAIDFDHQEGKYFNNSWVSYRTPRNRELTLTSSPYSYNKPGEYKILIKIIDIFGNETTEMREVSIN